jgi:hypothetical protein
MKEQYKLKMVLGGNIRVYLGSKYIGTYFSYGDMQNDINDLETRGSYWG